MTHRFFKAALVAVAVFSSTTLVAAQVDKPANPTTDKQGFESGIKIGFVNFRKAVEESKLGKQQQQAFEGMQNQMEASLLDLQKGLNEITTKLSDEDYLDGLSPEAENELKHKYRALSTELTRTQSQFMQTLQDANMKVLQMISAEVAEAAKEVAQTKGLDLIVNEEAAFYHRPSMDLSAQVVATMDAKFDREMKKAPNSSASASSASSASQKPTEKSVMPTTKGK